MSSPSRIGRGVCLVRYNPFQLILQTRRGKRFQLDKALARWPQPPHRMWRCAVKHPGGGWIEGRLLAVRKSQTAVAAAIEQVLRNASRKQYTIKRPVLEYAKDVMVFTTLPDDRFDTTLCLEWYRVGWQIELVFKRLKSLAGLGYLPKHDPDSSQAWLYGKLFTGLLTEKLIQYGESIAPGAIAWACPHRLPSRWREFAFALHQIQQAITPSLSLHQVASHWKSIAAALAEPSRRRKPQLHTLS